MTQATLKFAIIASSIIGFAFGFVAGWFSSLAKYGKGDQ
jgi:hypothetical protein